MSTPLKKNASPSMCVSHQVLPGHTQIIPLTPWQLQRLERGSAFGSSTLNIHRNVLLGTEQINTQVEPSVRPGAWGPSDRTLPGGSQYWADLQCSWVTPSPHCPIWSLPEGHLPEGQRWHSRWPLCYSGPQYPAGKWCRHMHGTIWLAYPSLQSAAL